MEKPCKRDEGNRTLTAIRPGQHQNQQPRRGGHRSISSREIAKTNQRETGVRGALGPGDRRNGKTDN
jgi:hypothetical protein